MAYDSTYHNGIDCPYCDGEITMVFTATSLIIKGEVKESEHAAANLILDDIVENTLTLVEPEFNGFECQQCGKDIPRKEVKEVIEKLIK